MQTADQTNYEKIVEIAPVYDRITIRPTEGTSAVTIGAAGGNYITFQLPARVFNLAQSTLSFTLTPPQTAARTNWHFLKTLPFRSVLLTTIDGRQIQEITDVNFISNMILPYTVKKSDFENNALMISGGPYGNGLCKNNVLTSSLLALRANATAPSQNYEEMKYLIAGTGGTKGQNQATPVMNYQIDLSMFKHSVLSVDKDLYFGPSQLQLRFTFDSASSMYFTATDSDSPTVGTAADLGGDKTVSASDIKLYLAVEKTQELSNAIIAQFNAGGYSINVDYPHVFRHQFGASTNQVADIKIGPSHGKTLKKIYHSIYNGTLSAGTRFDRTNVSAAKLTSFYTSLDNVRLQALNIVCASQEDWMRLQPQLAGSLILDSDVYNYNHCWVDVFDGGERLVDQVDDSQVSSGLDLNQKEYLWQFVATTPSAATNHFSLVVCSRELFIQPNRIGY